MTGSGRLTPPRSPMGSLFSAERPASSRHLARTDSGRFGSFQLDGLKGLESPLLGDKQKDTQLPARRKSGIGSFFRCECWNELISAIIYGLINAVVVAPVEISFASIIFRNAFFHAHPAVYSQLVKLVLFSSAVHQVVFSLTSSLPFAIGQVQDAGLIFLSSMADSMVGALEGAPHDEVFATVLVGLSLSTALLGVALTITGKLQLATLVQFLPLPVVGGYLAFIGLYCLMAGLTLMSGVQVTSLLGLDCVEQWMALIDPAVLVSVLPGIAAGIGILLILQRYQHFLVLPGLLVGIPVAFFVGAAVCGYSLQELRDMGLVAQAQPAGAALSVWSHFDLRLVHWELLPSLLPTWLGMYIVVAFSSALDVAAIQMDMGKQLDFNHELVTVGLSNAASGLFGGFTGSYIFSQTIFTFRTGIQSRMCGVVVIAVELLLFFLPVSIVAYVPKLFFGAVLTFIAADLLLDWLVRSHSKVHLAEYFIILFTFALVNLFGLEVGMSGGILVSILHFITDYARVPVVQRLQLRSNVIRSLPLTAELAKLQPQVITLRCRGYIFFGSILQIMDDVLDSIVLEPLAAAAYPNGLSGKKRATQGDGGGALGAAASPAPTRFVLFDFSLVSGLDATAARACFLNLCRTLAPFDITLVFGGVTRGGRMERLLKGHSIIGGGPDTALRFDTIDEALEFCENELLRKALPNAVGTALGLAESNHRGSDASSPFGRTPSSASIQELSHVLAPLVEPNWSDMLEGMAHFFEENRFTQGQTVFARGDAPHAIYFIVSGEVTLWESTNLSPPHPTRRRLVRYVNGGIFGELDFFLKTPRSFLAEASSTECTLLALRRDALGSMQLQASQLAAALQHALLKYLCFQVNAKLGLADGVKDVHSLT